MISASGVQDVRPSGISVLLEEILATGRVQTSPWAKGVLSAAWIGLLSTILLYISVSLVTTQFQHTNLLSTGEYSLARHLDGTVYRPFAYRVLTDWLARLMLSLHVTGHALPYIGAIATKACQMQLAKPAATCAQIEAYVLVEVGFAWSALVGLYVLALRLVGGHIWAAATAAIAALFVNAVLLQGFGQPYDFTTLFFSTVMFYLATQQQDTAFAGCLVVACLAKESFGLYVLIYALIGFGGRPLRQVLLNVVAQSVLFLVIYESERASFAGNGGASMYHNLDAHFQYLSNNTTLFSACLFLIFIILLLYRLAGKPPVLQRSMLILPVMLLLYIIGGQPGEFRIVFDVFPIVLLPVAGTLRQMVSGVADAPSLHLPTPLGRPGAGIVTSLPATPHPPVNA